jgi:Family of unknown function (DUF6459)
MPESLAIRTLRVPEIAPPYDDIQQDREGRHERARTRADRFAVGGGTGRAGQERPAAGAGITVPGPTGHPLVVTAAAWPSQFAQILAETLAGYRPERHLEPWTTERARRRISQLGPMLAGARQPRVRRVVLSAPAGDVLEMTIIVDVGSRIRAIAVRLEQPGRRGPADRRWRCTDVEAA